MLAKKWMLVFINLLGGIAVLGSYYYGLVYLPSAVDILWGGVPQGVRPVYTVSMFLAAAGYIVFTAYILFGIQPESTRLFKRFGYTLFHWIYLLILIPSALWLPLTYLAATQSSPVLLWIVQLVLALVGIASLTLLLSLINLKSPPSPWFHRAAIVGGVFFCIQTVLLDAIIWSVFIRVS
jgi:hypothetical protein